MEQTKVIWKCKNCEHGPCRISIRDAHPGTILCLNGDECPFFPRTSKFEKVHSKPSKKQKAIRDSIEHWKRLIKGVNDHYDELKEKPVQSSCLKELIGDTWGVSSCALCRKYYEFSLHCPKCPLAQKHGWCGVNAYKEIELAESWRGWTLAALKLLEQLKSLRK